MNKLILPGLIAVALTLPVMAATPRPANASATGEHLDIKAAMKACVAQVKVDASGHPDRAAFDACMHAKGFGKPAGLPQDERRGPKLPPPGKKPMLAHPETANASGVDKHAKIEAALKACAESGTAEAASRPDFAALDACMRAKGFEKPDGPPPGKRHGPKAPPPHEEACEPKGPALP